MAWLLLLVAAGFEIAFAASMKPADGFTRLWPSLAVVLFGSVGVVALGIAVVHEPLTLVRLGCIALIVAGVVGLRLAGSG